MELGSLLFLLLVLACPLAMLWMMRGGHGGHGHASHGPGHGFSHGHDETTTDAGSVDELRRRRTKTPTTA